MGAKLVWHSKPNQKKSLIDLKLVACWFQSHACPIKISWETDAKHTNVAFSKKMAKKWQNGDKIHCFMMKSHEFLRKHFWFMSLIAHGCSLICSAKSSCQNQLSNSNKCTNVASSKKMAKKWQNGDKIHCFMMKSHEFFRKHFWFKSPIAHGCSLICSANSSYQNQLSNSNKHTNVACSEKMAKKWQNGNKIHCFMMKSTEFF